VSVRALSEHALSILQSVQNENRMRQEMMAIAELFPKDSARHAAKAILECFLSLPSATAQRFHSKAVRDLIAEDNAWGLNK
ncbi:hypothetical protein EBR21_09060, partial [bacterium]|nr:hypothetical protein [bacterium]